MAGLGILNKQDIAPHARAAYTSESDAVLARILPSDLPHPLTSETAEAPTATQHQRCKPMWDAQLDDITAQAAPQAKLLLAEAVAPLGRRWLNTIPYYQPLRLSNHVITTGPSPSPPDRKHRLQLVWRQQHPRT